MRVNLITARKTANLTQRELGEMVGLTHTAISMIESGKSNGRIKNWKAIAKALGVKNWIELLVAN